MLFQLVYVVQSHYPCHDQDESIKPKKGHPWYKIPDKQIHYELFVGDDIDPQEWIENQSIPMASRRLTKYLEDYFNSQTSQKGSQ